MFKKITSIALIAIVFVFASGWSYIDVPSPKQVVFEDEFDFSSSWSYSEYNECAGEVIDYVFNDHNWGTIVIYDDGTLHQNLHYNYYNSSGNGQTTGNTYRLTGAGHFNLNSSVGTVVVITQQTSMTCQGMGVVSKLKLDFNIVTNANGDVVVERIGDFTNECL